jgi:hypothetical protein
MSDDPKDVIEFAIRLPKGRRPELEKPALDRAEGARDHQVLNPNQANCPCRAARMICDLAYLLLTAVFCFSCRLF